MLKDIFTFLSFVIQKRCAVFRLFSISFTVHKIPATTPGFVVETQRLFLRGSTSFASTFFVWRSLMLNHQIVCLWSVSLALLLWMVILKVLNLEFSFNLGSASWGILEECVDAERPKKKSPNITWLNISNSDCRDSFMLF